MIRIGLIPLSVFMLNSAGWAQTKPPCDSIDDILYSAALIKKAAASPDRQALVDRARELETLTRQISLPALTADGSAGDASTAFTEERAVLFQYLSNIREGAAAAHSGYENYARDVFTRAFAPDFSQSLLSLESHWQCRENRPRPEILSQDRLDNGPYQRARFNGGALGDEENISTPLENTAVGTTTAARRFSGGGSTLPMSQLDSVMPKASIGLFMLMMSLSLVVGVFYARARSHKTRVREQRRVLNIPISIKMGSTAYDAGLVDISMNGLKLEHAGRIKRPSKLHVQLGEMWYLGQIKWHNKLYAGVKFKKPIDADTLSAVITSADN